MILSPEVRHGAVPPVREESHIICSHFISHNPCAFLAVASLAVVLLPGALAGTPPFWLICRFLPAQVREPGEPAGAALSPGCRADRRGPEPIGGPRAGGALLVAANGAPRNWEGGWDLQGVWR